MNNYVDADELPFTPEELYLAGRLFMPDAAAREVADHLVAEGPWVIAERDKRRATWARAGVPGAERMPLYAHGYPEDLMPALAALSADAEARVDRLKEAEWAERLQQFIQAEQYNAAERSGLIPSREVLIARAELTVKGTPEESLMRQGLVIGLPPVPPPTPEMIRLAEARVDGLRRNWKARVARFRGRGRGDIDPAV